MARRAAWAFGALLQVAALLGVGLPSAQAARPAAPGAYALLLGSLPSRVQTGEPLHLTVRVVTRQGVRVRQDRGRRIVLHLQTGSRTVTLVAQDRWGGVTVPWTAGPPGIYRIQAVAPPLRPADGQLVVVPRPPVASRLAFAPTPPGSWALSAPLALTVTVESALGQPVPQDHGRPVHLTVALPNGRSVELSAEDRHGLATFFWIPSVPGTARLTASAPGLAPAEASLEVFQPTPAPYSLTLEGGPNLNAAQGVPLAIVVAALTAAGQVDQADSGRAFTAVLTPTAGGTPITLSGTDSAGIATLVWTAPQEGAYTLSVSAQGVAAVTGSVTVGPAPTGLALTAAQTSVPPGGTAPLQITLLGAGGTPLDVPAPFTLSLAPGSVGSLSTASGVLPPPGAPAAQFAAGEVVGSATVVAQVGSLTAQLALTVPPLGQLAFSSTEYTATAGVPVSVAVTLGPPPAGGAAPPSPVPVTLTVAGPAGQPSQTFTATTVAGTATFTFTLTAAGSYSLSASAPGMAPAPPAALTVGPGAPAHLALVLTSAQVVAGQSVGLSLTATDAYGNPIPPSAPFAVSLSFSPQAAGTFAPAASLLTGPGSLGQFSTSPSFAGAVTFVVAAQNGLTAAASLEVTQNRALLVSGKGMWLMYQDWADNPSSQLVATAVKDHIHCLFLEVATTHDGFYGQNALNDLLPKAHAAHLVVIAWVYTALYNPAADAAMSIAVAKYRTPSGQQVDGLAADIEANLDPAAVNAYAAAVRKALPDTLFIAITYPPLYHMSYPYAVLAKYVDVIAPMDYWHSMPKAFSQSYVYQYVVNSIDTIRKLDGNPSLPIAVIGQAYDMFTASGTGPNNPTPAEILGGFTASEADGAIGFSLYRWGTADAAEWKLWAGLEWNP